MTKEEKKITVKYKTKRDFCRCCHRRLDESELSGVREFDFYEKNFKEYGDWSLYEPEELDEVVEEFVYETIDFFAVSNHDAIILCEGEMDRMHQFVKVNIVK